MWAWLIPLFGAAATFCGVLLTTPPGFRALVDAATGAERGPNADAAAYALGAAASLALVVLLLLAALCYAITVLLRQLAVSNK